MNDKLNFLNRGNRREVYISEGKILKKLIKESNLNNQEYQIFNSLKNIIDKKFNENFMNIIDLNENYLICELIKNYDNSISKNLSEFDLKKLDLNFFEKIKEIILFLLDNGFYYFDLNSKNILVREIKKGIFIPVFCDYKTINRKYPFQINLLFENQKKKKVIRRLNRILDLNNSS